METSNTLNFSGKLLIPGFSIYLMEVTVDGVYDDEEGETLSTWYYIGMTGDNYYPSARSAFHRISGHLELTGTSTQNQLYNGIKGLFEGTDSGPALCPDKTWEDVNITMTSYPIEGFDGQHWQDRRASKEEDFKFNKKYMAEITAKSVVGEYIYPQYKSYKEHQKAVATFEKQLIRYAKGKLKQEDPKRRKECLFNGGAASEVPFGTNLYGAIAKQICGRMKIEW